MGRTPRIEHGGTAARIAAALAAVLIAVVVTGAVPALSSSSAGSVRITLLPATTAVASVRPRWHVPPPRVRDPAVYRREKAAANRGYTAWAARHGSPAEATPARPYTAVYSGLNAAGISATNLTPPNSTGAAGPSNYVEAVNSEVAVYSKTNLAAPPQTTDLSTFVGDATALTCDPEIQWDPQGQRWLYIALNCAANAGQQALYLGWSTTPSPDLSGSWCRYTISTGHAFEDYPRLGHDNSQIIIGTNAFSDTIGSYIASHIWIFDKPAAGVTSCPSAGTLASDHAEISTTGADFTPVPANIVDSSTNGYVVAGAGNSRLDLYTVGHDGAGANTVLAETSVTVPTFATPASVPQPGTTQPLSAGDGRLTQAVAATDPATGHEGVWTQHTVLGPQNGPDVVAWYELTAGSSTPTQQGTVTGPNSTFAFNAAISPTKNGRGAAIFYNSGSSAQAPALRVADRRSTTPLGTTIEDLQLATSGYADDDFSCPNRSGRPACRWDDYAGATPDPSNPCVVWGTSELTVYPIDPSGKPQWGTRNAAVDVCAFPLKVTRFGTGSGTVVSSPSGLHCGPMCTFTFADKTKVTLTPTPSTGSGFTTWTGACSGTGVCQVAMTSAKFVGAKFSKCVVPKVTGLTLLAAKSAIAAAYCRTGTITNATSKTVAKGHVISQSPAAGKIEPYHFAVNLVVSTGT